MIYSAPAEPGSHQRQIRARPPQMSILPHLGLIRIHDPRITRRGLTGCVFAGVGGWGGGGVWGGGGGGGVLGQGGGSQRWRGQQGRGVLLPASGPRAGRAAPPAARARAAGVPTSGGAAGGLDRGEPQRSTPFSWPTPFLANASSGQHLFTRHSPRPSPSSPWPHVHPRRWPEKRAGPRQGVGLR
jgi:hypothetical protein